MSDEKHGFHVITKRLLQIKGRIDVPNDNSHSRFQTTALVLQTHYEDEGIYCKHDI